MGVGGRLVTQWPRGPKEFRQPSHREPLGWEDKGTSPKPQIRDTYLGDIREEEPCPGKGRWVL